MPDTERTITYLRSVLRATSEEVQGVLDDPVKLKMFRDAIESTYTAASAAGSLALREPSSSAGASIRPDTDTMGTNTCNTTNAIASSSSSNNATSTLSVDSISSPWPSLKLGSIELSGADFCCPAVFWKLGNTKAEPCPLNMVVRILKNKRDEDVGKLMYRTLIVDIGDGQYTKLIVKKGSTLYNVRRFHEPYFHGTIATLKRLISGYSNGALCLRFNEQSTVSRFDVSDNAAWLQDVSWHGLMKTVAQRSGII